MIECPREAEIVEAYAGPGFGPASDMARLQQHVDECSSCRDAASVVAALRSERDTAWEQAAPPSSEVVWLRAQLRARTEAARLASRPVVVVQALGIACVVGAVAAVAGTALFWLRSWVAWLSDAAATVAGSPTTFEMATVASRGILLAVGVWLVLAPVAVYLAATDD